VLEQAACAVEQKNWSLLNQCLQQLPVKRNSAGAPGGKQPADPDIDLVLALALEILETGDFHQRWEVAKVFPRLGSIAIAPLVAILADEAEEDRELHWFAARILGDLHDPEAISALVTVLKTNKSEDLTAMAAAALASLGASSKNATAFRLAIDALTDMLNRDATRSLAVKALSHIRHSETITPLLSVIRDKEVTVRTTAIEALASFQDDRIPPVLLDALKDTAAPVRREATMGLGFRPQLQEELELVAQLTKQLWDLNLEVCNAAAIALGRMGTDAAADALFAVLRKGTAPISLQVQIVRSLGWIETPKALIYLQKAIAQQNGSQECRKDAENGRQGRGESFSQTFTALPCHHVTTSSSLSMRHDPEKIDLVCQEIIAVLGRVQKPDVVPLAAKILLDTLNCNYPTIQHPRVKQALATSLGHLKDPAAIDSLIQMLADGDEGVKWHAIAALKKFSGVAPKLEALGANKNLTPALQQGIAIALENFRF
ncbi:MAG TPA: PBS lyase, partial [Cyanobacteria bacterium UBA11372]|nr:PBS lyase [Cyanobacteria bacterium UBA11372]